MPPSSPKASMVQRAGKAWVDAAEACAKFITDNLTKKNVAKLVAGTVVSGGGMAVDAASGAAAAAKGDKKGAKDPAVNVVKGAGSLAATAVAGPVGTVAFNAATFAGGKAKNPRGKRGQGSGMVQEEGAQADSGRVG
ncbi:unnamed protein product [Closterium sp. Naga37s-1]|nr:unnamed protein product [Closterium sp. Naga37s-1]